MLDFKTLASVVAINSLICLATNSPALAQDLGEPTATAEVGTVTSTTEQQTQTTSSTDAAVAGTVTNIVKVVTVPQVVTVQGPPIVTSTEPVYDNASLGDEPVVLEPQMQSNITFIAGGIGERERKAMQLAENQYSLKVLNANAKSMLVGDSAINIKNAKGEVVLQTESGPILLAKMPPGSYNLFVTQGGKTQAKKVVIRKGLSRVNFIW